MKYLSLFIIIIFFFFIFDMRAPAEGAEQLMELFSEEELVQMGGYGEQKLSTVLITGSVLCASCLQPPASEPHLSSSPLSGAMVGVYCNNITTYIEYNSTRRNGEFTIDLPSHLHAIPDLETQCWVELLRVPEISYSCRPAYVKLKKRITISSVCDGTRSYDAGTIKLLHSATKPSASCTDRDSETTAVEPTSR